MSIERSSSDGRPRLSAAFGTRLVIAQTMVLVAGAATSWWVATSVGPGIFSEHLREAGVAHTPPETAHVEAAFSSALVLALVVALLVSMSIALAVTWFITRRVQRSINMVTNSAAQIATGDYRSRAVSHGLGREFEVLTTTINELAERLDAVERTRRSMLSDLAHEMRTPISTIEAHLEAIEDGVRAADAETLAVITANTSRLERLARDISAVSKAEEGQLDVELSPVQAADLVHAAIAAASNTAEARGVLLVERADTTSTQVLADPLRMGQVLGNLLDNAIRHSHPGGKITVSSRAIDRRKFEFAVADEGDGIAPEHIGHVFDRFYRADTARNRAQGGSGIGLTITRALVEAHRGHISAVSPGEGLGATFTIQIPIAR